MERIRKAVIGLMVLVTAATLSACGGGGGGDGLISGPTPTVQPTRALVSIAFDQAVPNLAGLTFKLDNTAGATFDNDAQQIAAINNAAEGSLVLANFDAATNSTMIGLANQAAGGISTGTSPIIKITYAVAASAGEPTFSVDVTSSSTFSAVDPDLQPITSVTATNLVVTVTYDTGP